MRKVSEKEIEKRGCLYCTDYKRIKEVGKVARVCKHSKCPYHELDTFDTYEEYLKSEDAKFDFPSIR